MTGPNGRQPLLVMGRFAESTEADWTAKGAIPKPGSPNCLGLRRSGIVLPLADGTADIVARVAGREAKVCVTIRNMTEASRYFRTDVIAAFSCAGCNPGACHGSPQGKNGFRLSLRGYDPDLDLFTLTKENAGRRVDRLARKQSDSFERFRRDWPSGRGALWPE